MKRFMMSLVLMVAIAASAAAMSFSKARKEALFLSDKMAYELNLSLSQYEAVYEINLDYMLGLNSYADVDGVFWMRRNADLRYVLSMWQWERYCQIVDFYRPMVWISGHRFTLSLRTRYTNKHFYYYERPSIYGSYRGGHNAGNVSYYHGRDFHQPTNNVGPQRYGSSAPAPQGSGRPSGSKNQPSYSIGTPSTGNPAGSNSGSVRGRADANSNSRSQGTMNSNSSSRSGSTTTNTNSGSSRGSSTTTNTNSGSSRGGSGSSRGGGNSGGRRGGR